MKYFVILSAMLLAFNSLSAQRPQLDTIYYDNNWKGVEYKEFASFYRVALTPKDTTVAGKYRDYFMNGTLQSEGGFISIDRNDDSKTIFEGRCMIYYQNGKIKNVIDYTKGVLTGIYEYYLESGQLSQKATYKDGLLDGNSEEYYDNGVMKSKFRYRNGNYHGKCTEYAPSGLVTQEGNYKDGKLHGLFTQFLEDGTYKQLEYEEGYPSTEYYYYGTPTGQISRVRLSDNSLYWEKLTEADRKTTYRKGETWQYYSQNGLTIAMTNTLSNEYGKWFKLDIIITNDSVEPQTFDPYYGIKSWCSKGDKLTYLDVWPYEAYMNRVNNRQALIGAIVAVGEGLSNVNAGYSTSTTQTKQVYSGQVNSSGVGAAVGVGAGAVVGSGGYAVGTGVGAAVGAYANSTSYAGSSSTTSTTVTYDAGVALQKEVLTEQKLQALGDSFYEERAAIEKGYLEKTVIYPGETISGFVYVQRKPGEVVEFVFNIGGCDYKYTWAY